MGSQAVPQHHSPQPVPQHHIPMPKPQHHIPVPKPQHHILCPYLSIASDSLTIWAMSLLWIFCCTSSSWALVHLYLMWERQQ